MKLACCGTLNDDIVGSRNIVDYLLFALNKKGNFNYVNYMKLGEYGPQEDSKLMLARAAVANDWIQNVKDVENGGLMQRPHYERAAEVFLKGFRDGSFGPCLLDNEYFL